MVSSPQKFLNFPYFDLMFTLYAFRVGFKCPHNLNTCFQVNDSLGSCETGEVWSSWQSSWSSWSPVEGLQCYNSSWFCSGPLGCKHTYSQFPPPDPPEYDVNTHAASSHHLIYQDVDAHTASSHRHRTSCPSYPSFFIMVDL